jgi:hypothetical protein
MRVRGRDGGGERKCNHNANHHRLILATKEPDSQSPEKRSLETTIAYWF